jgi:hypothetical protein
MEFLVQEREMGKGKWKTITKTDNEHWAYRLYNFHVEDEGKEVRIKKGKEIVAHAYKYSQLKKVV